MVRLTGGPVPNFQSQKGRCQIRQSRPWIGSWNSDTGGRHSGVTFCNRKLSYDAFKARIISAFTVSEEMENRKLFVGLELGHQNLSQLVRAMRMKAAYRVNDNFLKTLWLQRLPSNVQAILSISETSDLIKLSEMTDRIMEMRTLRHSSCFFFSIIFARQYWEGIGIHLDVDR